MKKLIAVCASLAALATGGAALAQDFQAAASQDVAAIHDALRDNAAAAVVERDSAAFRAWLDAGYEKTRTFNLAKVNNAASYGLALNYYVNGFRDAFIRVRPSGNPIPVHFAQLWPGFATAWRNGAYVVAWSNNQKNPPVGARLIACDRKPAETLALERLDLFEGDLKRESERFRTAPYLLWDRANTFVGPMPAKCDWDVAGSRKTFPLVMNFGGDAERRAAYAAAAPKPEGVGIEPFGQGGFWISLHSFAEDQPWDAFYAQIDANKAALKAAPVIVIDLRGADTGYAARAYQFANHLWDPVYVQSLQPPAKDIAYRVTPANRAFYADALARMQSNDLYFYARQRVQDLLARFDAAAAAGQPLLRRDESGTSQETAPANPLGGRVLVLTDSWCAANCLDFMDLAARLPNITHIGAQTNADTIFVGRVETTLPSGLSVLAYGDKAWLDRPRPSGQGYAPAKVYPGAFNDEAALKAWVQGL